ncbi:hypothetical protein K0817_014735 [Microbacterium sp. HD4P20]|uniref:hypothetical protein n=1 Tax=Microbacterium sp. HD4P20 TaxID=2864874 RepID=UPI0020A59D4E|nr:hypothetical protein [Microbacterium sp. HD4P20]MCP2637808.1 hypothetical protein [Microbacterium sp. HD4P20]
MTPALGAALLLLALTGCTVPQPEPTPTAPFTSEEEAFAAAEETYRAYVDALNEVDLSDPETFEEVYAWTTGEANASERKSLSEMHADGWAVSGETRTRAIFGEELGEDGGVRILVCSDVSAVVVTDAAGTSMVAADRPDVYPLRVELLPSAQTSTGLVISASNAVEEDRCTTS